MPAFARFYDAIRHPRARALATAEPVDGPLPDAPYVLLVTYKRSGEGVATPVWAARDGERLVFRTEVDTGKVRRIRHDPRVRVAPCSFRGRPKGPPVEARARILGPADAIAERLLAAKYGLRRCAYERVAPLGEMVYVEITR